MPDIDTNVQLYTYDSVNHQFEPYDPSAEGGSNLNGSSGNYDPKKDIPTRSDSAPTDYPSSQATNSASPPASLGAIRDRLPPYLQPAFDFFTSLAGMPSPADAQNQGTGAPPNQTATSGPTQDTTGIPKPAVESRQQTDQDKGTDNNPGTGFNQKTSVPAHPTPKSGPTLDTTTAPKPAVKGKQQNDQRPETDDAPGTSSSPTTSGPAPESDPPQDATGTLKPPVDGNQKNDNDTETDNGPGTGFKQPPVQVSQLTLSSDGTTLGQQGGNVIRVIDGKLQYLDRDGNKTGPAADSIRLDDGSTVKATWEGKIAVFDKDGTPIINPSYAMHDVRNGNLMLNGTFFRLDNGGSIQVTADKTLQLRDPNGAPMGPATKEIPLYDGGVIRITTDGRIYALDKAGMPTVDPYIKLPSLDQNNMSADGQTFGKQGDYRIHLNGNNELEVRDPINRVVSRGYSFIQAADVTFRVTDGKITGYDKNGNVVIKPNN